MRAAVAQAESALQGFARNAQSSLDAAFAGRNIAPAMRVAVEQAISAARRGMEAQLSGARQALARGLIDDREFAVRAKRAGDDASKQLSGAFARLSTLGLLPPDVSKRLGDDLSAAAKRAGEQASAQLVRSMRASTPQVAPQMGADQWKLGEVKRVVGGLSTQLNAELTAAREQLFRGLIDPAEFQRRAQAAATQFNAGLLGGISRLSARFKLPPELHQYMVAQLRDAGLKAGQEAGKEISRGLALTSRLTSRIQLRYEQTGTANREALARGEIDREEFARRGQAAAQAFNASLLKGLDGLRQRKLLSPEVHRQLVAQLKDAGMRAGQEAGQQISRGMQLAGRLMSRTQLRFDQTTANDRESLARGLISPEEFAKRGREAAVAFNDSVLRGLDGLKRRGLLSPDVHRQLVAQLRDAGIDAGRAAADAITEQLARAGSTLQTAGQRLTLGLTLPLAGIAGVSVKAATEMDSLRRGLEAVSDPADNVSDALERLKEVAKLPGLDFRGAIRGSTNLQAAGLSASLAERSLKGFGNALATVGRGSADLDGVNLALTQIASKSKVSAQEIQQLAERVPQIRRVMQSAFQTADTEALQALGVAPMQFIEAIVTELEKLPPVSAGASRAFEDFSDSAFRARVAIGDQLLPAVTPLVTGLANTLEGLQRVNPETVRMGVAIAGATAVIGPATTAVGGLVRTVAALRTANLALATTLGPAGAVIIGLSLLTGWLVKNKLDSLEAAAAVDRYRQSLAGLDQMGRPDLLGKRTELESKLRLARMLDSRIKSLNDRMKQGGASALSADELTELRNLNQRRKGIGAETAEIAANLAQVNQQLDRVKGTAAGSTNAISANVSALTDEVELLRKLSGMRKLNAGEAQRLATAEQKLRTLVTSGKLSLEDEIKARQALAATKSEIKEVAAALKSLKGDAAVATLLGDAFASADPKLRAAAENTDKLRKELEEAEKAFKRLGGEAPEGTATAIADLRQRLTQARSELARFVDDWQKGVSVEQIERAFTQTIGKISEQFARGEIDRGAMEEQGRQAARDFNAALLRYLATHELKPEVRAEIQAKLKLDVSDDALTGFERKYAATISQLNEDFARRKIDRATLDAKGREAGRTFNEAVLAYLDAHELTPEVRATITARLKLDIPEDTPARLEREYAQTIGQLNELFARGKINHASLEKQGKEAAETFNKALLKYLSETELDPRVKAELQARLKLDLGDGAAWKEMSSAAGTATQGVLNVGEAFGKMGDQSRRALTGVSALAQGIGQLKSGSLMQLGNLPGLAGIAGAASQIIAAALQKDPAEEARHHELVGALNDLAAKIGGFRATANAIQKTAVVAQGVRNTKGPISSAEFFFAMLDKQGLTLQEIVAVAKEFGVALINDKGQLDINKLASKEFGKILEQASKSLTGFRNTLDDQKRRQALAADLFNLPTDAASGLAQQMEMLQTFMKKFAAGLGEIDTATAEGRARLEAEIQRMFQAFQAGSLDLEDLTRDEFLSLMEGFAGAFDKFREATDKASGALLNVPAIFDLALRRRQAAIAGATAEPIGARVARTPQAIDPANRIAHLLEGLAAPAEVAGTGLSEFAGLLDHLNTPVGTAAAALARLGGAADAGAADFGDSIGRLAGLLDGVGTPMGVTADRAAHLARAFDATAAPLEGFTASVTSAWEQLDRLMTRAIAVPAPPSGAAPVTPGGTSGGGRVRPVHMLNVEINNPPAGMDVPRTATMLKNALKYDPEVRMLIQRVGAN